MRGGDSTFAATQPIPDTGITKCYNYTAEIPCPTAGQDANYSINPMSYTKLDSTGKDLPITATTWAMVKDNVTGLIWENNSHYSEGYKAPNVISELNNSKFGGYSDWRLPNMTELGSIVDFSMKPPIPTINTNYFKDTSSKPYWSSSSTTTTNAFRVNFDHGAEDIYDKYQWWGYVRAVRGGQPVIGSYLIINGDGTVSDSTTGLMWQQDTAKTATGGITMVWKDALSYCENLTLGGYTDWRLPTVKELRSIVDYSIPYPGPTIDTSVFKDGFASSYWTSSTTRDTYAWGVSFDFGIVESGRIMSSISGYKRNSNYVRAVRGGQAENDTTLPSLALSSSSGASATVNLTLTNVTGTNIAAISTDIDFDDSILENPTAVIGAAGTAAGKSITGFDAQWNQNVS